MHSSYWKNTVIVIVWDDFGGFYDPVVPPHYDIMGLGPRVRNWNPEPWGDWRLADVWLELRRP